jgi:hypothetical protein
MASSWYKTSKPPTHWVVFEQLIQSGGNLYLKGINHIERSNIMSTGYYRVSSSMPALTHNFGNGT